MLHPLGGQANGTASDRQLAGGRSLAVYMWVSFEPGAHVPSHLRHQVVTADATAEGAVIETRHTELKVLASPVLGADWLASDAPSNDSDNHHRRGIFIVDGHPTISRRYAIDWMQVKNGASFSGDARAQSFLLRVRQAGGRCGGCHRADSKDGLPDNVPGHNTPEHEGFRPAVPITMATVARNMITLDLGSGQFAYYCHLQPSSEHVKVGERVKRGEVMALIGDSGDAREPQLHFEISNSPKLLAGERLPYLIDHFRVKSGNDWLIRTRAAGKGHGDRFR